MFGILALVVLAGLALVASSESPVMSGPATDGTEVPFPYVPGVLMKRGVKHEGIRAETILAVKVAKEAFVKLGLGELVVTSVADGTHLPTSLHYKFLAVDLRTRHLSVSQRQKATAEMRRYLGAKYDVLNEGPGPGHDAQNAAAHIHAEFDP